MKLPGKVRCACLLSGGRCIEVNAEAALELSRMTAPVKIRLDSLSVSDALPDPRRTLLAAILCARIHEPLEEVYCQVEHRVSVVNLPGTTTHAGLPHPPVTLDEMGMRAAELCAVVADRASRGLMAHSTGNYQALGQCSDWVTGRIHALPTPLHEASLQDMLNQPDAGPVTLVLPDPPNETCAKLYEAISIRNPLARVLRVQSIAGLCGQVTAQAAIRRQRVSFPVLAHSPQEQDALWELEVVVRQLYPGEFKATHITGLLPGSRSVQQRIEQVLAAVRAPDPHGQHWNTLVRMPPVEIQQHSFELALALADRMARGREFAGPGRVLATGAIAAGVASDSDNGQAVHPAGQVLDVGGRDRKQALLAREAIKDDTLLLPAAWQGQVSFDFASFPVGNRPQVIYVSSVRAPV